MYICVVQNDQLFKKSQVEVWIILKSELRFVTFLPADLHYEVRDIKRAFVDERARRVAINSIILKLLSRYTPRAVP